MKFKEDYRGSRRNAMKGMVWRGIVCLPPQYVPIYLNRSRHLPPARSYAEAREIAAEALAR